MESITNLYRDAIRNNSKFYLEGKLTADECDKTSRADVRKYLEARNHVIDVALSVFS